MTYGHPYTGKRNEPRNLTDINGNQIGVKDTSYENAKKIMAEVYRKSEEHARFMQSFGAQHGSIDTEQIELYHEIKLMEDGDNY